MKTLLTRIVVILVCALLVSSAAVAQEISLRGYSQAEGYQYIHMGAYPQFEDGREAYILWRVLSVSENEAFLLSEHVLFNHRVHEDFMEYESFEGQFNKTEIFGILNGAFLEGAFSEAERALLYESDELGTVFLVSGDDLKDKTLGFTSNKARQAFGTPYALANGLFKYRNTPEGRGSSPYWTRSRSTTLPSGVRCTKVDGSVGYIRCVVMDEGIRPAVLLSLNEGLVSIVSGDGTLEMPYLIEAK